MRIGIIGCGRAVSSLHLPALARLNGVRVVAVADVDAERRESLARQWRIPRQYAEAGAVGADEEVDVVLIATPTATHAAAFEAVAKSGKHVYLEKPMALHLEEAERMIRAWEGVSAKATMGFNLRSHRLVRRAKEMLERGALGRVQYLRTVIVGGIGNRPAWQMQAEAGGGPVYELGVHHFDLWRYLLAGDKAQTVRGLSSVDGEVVSVAAQFGSGVVANGSFVMSGVAAHEVEIGGERGTIRFSMYRGDSFQVLPMGRIGELQTWLRELPAAAQAARERGDYQHSYCRHWESFFESIRSGGLPPASLEDGREALRMVREAIG